MGFVSATGPRLTMLSAAKPRQVLACTILPRLIGSQPSFSASRSYATSDSLGGHKTSSRKQVTIRNDDGRVQWNDLTTGEKAARTTQQTFNLGVVLAGLAGTVRYNAIIFSDTSSYSPDHCFLSAVYRSLRFR